MNKLSASLLICAAAMTGWIVFESIHGELVLLGRCDAPTFADGKPRPVPGFLERRVSTCLYCTLDSAQAGYRYMEFEVTAEGNNMAHIRRRYGVPGVGFYRVTFEARSEAERKSQQCDDQIPAFERFRSSAWCPQLEPIAEPSADYLVSGSLTRRRKFTGILNESLFTIENRRNGEVLGRYQSYSWSPTGPIASILNPTAWPLGYGGATCPEKAVPDPQKLLPPLRPR